MFYTNICQLINRDNNYLEIIYMHYLKIHNAKISSRSPYLWAFLVSLIITVTCIVTFFKLSILSSFSPIAYTSDKNIDEYYDSGTHYVNCHADTLYYTGYDYLRHNSVKGHYYYSLTDSKCTIYLISSSYLNNTKNPPLTLENVNFNAALKKDHSNLKPLLEYMASDLNWNYHGISRHTSTVLVSEYNYTPLLYAILFMLCFICIGTTIVLCISTWNHRDYGVNIENGKNEEDKENGEINAS